uniref:Cell death inducing DFFA like effector a n=1 Tax=Xiphophorus maculatus TaxID=8083 RepID=A0A3B5QFI2_XIPMA
MMFVISADLLPIRSVSTVHTAVSRRVLPSSGPRRHRVCTVGQRRRRGLLAAPLPQLLEQAVAVFTLSCCSVLTLVLEEDGTVVDSEEFFQALPSGAPLMVLDEGQTWFQSKVRPRKGRGPPPPVDGGEPPGQSGLKRGVFRLTFDLYKVQPTDLQCSLAVRATLLETSSLSYDFRFSRVQHVLR